ncbi:MAG: thioredoxin domain-containing protein [Proteobacteria bacterium]|nr:thioredoxin domain-containing protein [Pseudomonadota bacterium]
MRGNRLGDETSPYLRQHKDNPVHWYAWGDDAFAAARREQKPILLSVGYAACHWCHVMAHESFENETVARRMNDAFINIKVDREERPDIDNIYQTALMSLGEQGGWPLTMFLTPAGEPFWGGTYFPPTARYGRPGFTEILDGISGTYAKNPDQIAGNVAALKEALSKALLPAGGGSLDRKTLDAVAADAIRMVDPYSGGTQGAPKFPQPMFFRFLWHAYLRTNGAMFRDAVILTLDNICQGGIYDHAGGGYARYSTDAEWLAPHFEKMLYDNALLIELMSDVWLETKSPLYRARTEESIGWLLREMKAEENAAGFALASALDADSEGEEGKYYVWSEAEIDAVLGADAGPFKHLYDVTKHGNWEGSNILNRSHHMDWIDTTEAAMRPLLEKLLEVRGKRIPPMRDDKVLADWNGMIVAALARAGIVYGRPDWIQIAATVFKTVTLKMTAPDGRLRHALCDGRLAHPAVLDDYAQLARAALMLAEATADQTYIGLAEQFVETVERHYGDDNGGGYFLAANDTTDLIVRSKPGHDNAVPSGNGAMAEVLVRLHFLTGQAVYREQAERLFNAFAGDTPRSNINHPTLLIAYEMLNRGTQVVIAGDDADAAALWQTALASPNRLSIVSRVRPGAALPENHPAAGKGTVDGRAAAYVCTGMTCGLPITEPDKLIQALTPP